MMSGDIVACDYKESVPGIHILYLRFKYMNPCNCQGNRRNPH